MISVEIHYTKKEYDSGREKYIFKDIFVNGHSCNDGTPNAIKCCAGVTAVTCGLINLLSENRYCAVEIRKGYFHYKYLKLNEEINYAINALVYQLESIYITYPNHFNNFDFIEEKENGEENN